MYRSSQENECDGNVSACFIVCGSTGNLEYLGNKSAFENDQEVVL